MNPGIKLNGYEPFPPFPRRELSFLQELVSRLTFDFRLGLAIEVTEEVMTSQASRLALLKGRLEKAQHRIEEQAARVEQLTADGLDTVAAQHLLATYLTLVTLFIMITEDVEHSIRDFPPSGPAPPPGRAPTLH